MWLLQDPEPTELELQMEIERLVVEEFAKEQYSDQSLPDVLQVHTPVMPTPSSKKKKSQKQR